LITADGFLRKGKPIPMKQTADAAVAQSPGVKHVIVHKRLGIEVPWTPGRDLGWHDLLASRTTGRPKGAVHVHGGFLVKIAEEVAYQTDLRDGDV